MLIINVFDCDKFNLNEIIEILLGIWKSNDYYNFVPLELLNRLKIKVENSSDLVPQTIFEIIG